MGLIAYVQEMVHVKQSIESMNLNVKLPMTIKFYNRGAKDSVKIRVLVRGHDMLE
jgi:translation initiation factor IF-3